MIRNAVSAESTGSRFGRLCMLWFLQLLVSKYRAAGEPLPASFEASMQQPLQVMTAEVAACAIKSDQEIKNTYQTLAYFTAASIACFDRGHFEPPGEPVAFQADVSEHGR